jgi:hypothetical protein
MSDRIEEALGYIDEQSLTSLLTDMIDIPSPVGGEREIALYLEDCFRKAGTFSRTRMQEVEPGRLNVVGVLEGSGDSLAAMSPDEIKQRGLLPASFLPLPRVKHATGGQVIPERQIQTIRDHEARDLRRFDVNFDLPDHLMPEFPPPIFSKRRSRILATCRGASFSRSRTSMRS